MLRLWYHNNNYYEFDHLPEINLGNGKVTNDGDKKTQILQLTIKREFTLRLSKILGCAIKGA